MNMLYFTYWALAAHAAKLVAPARVPNTFAIALFVACAGEAINLFVKTSVNRERDFLTHWVPLVIVWRLYGADIRGEDVELLLGLLIAYLAFYRFRFGAIYKLYSA